MYIMYNQVLYYNTSNNRKRMTRSIIHNSYIIIVSYPDASGYETICSYMYVSGSPSPVATYYSLVPRRVWVPDYM